MTEAKARKELAEEEERRLAAGGSTLHATSASSFVIMGLEIEETQYVMPLFHLTLHQVLQSTGGESNVYLKTSTHMRQMLKREGSPSSEISFHPESAFGRSSNRFICQASCSTNRIFMEKTTSLPPGILRMMTYGFLPDYPKRPGNEFVSKACRPPRRSYVLLSVMTLWTLSGIL
jgi:hypothetical protein